MSHEPDWLPGEPKPETGIVICGALVMLLYFAGVVAIGTGIINDKGGHHEDVQNTRQ